MMPSFISRITLAAAAAAPLVLSAAPPAAADPAAEQWMRALDQNADGAISRQELAAHRLAAFMQWDENGDGAVSFADRRLAAARPKALAHFILAHDANRDGAVSPRELAAGPTPTFDHFDWNGDHRLSGRELEAFAAAARSAPKARPADQPAS